MREDAPSPGDRRATLLLRLGADGKVDLEVTAGLRRALPGPLLEEAMRATLGRMSCTASELQAQGGPDAERSNASNKLPWKTTPLTGATTPRVLATTPRPAFAASSVSAHQGKSAATRVSSGGAGASNLMTASISARDLLPTCTDP